MRWQEQRDTAFGGTICLRKLRCIAWAYPSLTSFEIHSSMKPLKIIIPIVAMLLLAGIAFFIWKMTDHTEEFSAALYSGNVSEVEDILKAHPSLVNIRHMESRWNGGRLLPAAGNWSPMHVAAFMNNGEMVKLLARYHADMNPRDKRGLTPLLWTAFAGQRDAAVALIMSGADINARGLDGRTTLDLAKLSLDTNLIEILRQRGAKE